MKIRNPIAPFSPVHFAGCLLVASSGSIVYFCAARHSVRGVLAAIALGTLGGLCLTFAPFPFEMDKAGEKKDPASS